MDWTIDIELNDMRAPDYKATYTTDRGIFEVEEPLILNTFKGRTSDGKIARFTIDENTFSGVILGDDYHYVIRPAKDYTQNREDNSFVVYKSGDIIPDDNEFDYINDALEIPHNSPKIIIGGLVGLIDGSNNINSCTYFLKIATDADFQYHQARGSISAATTNNHILSILNIAEGIYESTFSLRFAITFQNVYTTNSQLYTSHNAETLLNSFRSHWNNNHAGVNRNIAHLFTGKNLNLGVFGIAWKG